MVEELTVLERKILYEIMKNPGSSITWISSRIDRDNWSRIHRSIHKLALLSLVQIRGNRVVEITVQGMNALFPGLKQGGL